MLYYLYNRPIYNRLISYKTISCTFLHSLQQSLHEENIRTSLELLPNEILLDIFDYFDGVNLLRSFYDLNSRFNLLLYTQFRAYRFDFGSISKREFDVICEQHLPFIADQVTALSLVDSKWTPGLINLFFSYMISISHFTHLRYLKLSGLRSYEILIKIVDEFHQLCNLTHLYLSYCDCQNDETDFQLIINNIWSLPKLTHCSFESHITKQNNFCLPTKLSTSLKDLDISDYTLKYNQIHKLLDYTSCLKRLSISIKSDDNEDYKPSPLPTLIDLNISTFSISDTSTLISFLQNIPNLRRLDVRFSNLINGYQWEQIIRKYLPKLKVFELKMKNKYPTNENIQERADELINSFRNLFWIDEHKWFVRCTVYGKTIHLETLSDTFHHFQRNFPDSWKSTYPYDDYKKFYNTMNHIFSDTFFQQPIPSYIHLQDIIFLTIKLPISDNFWSIIPNLNQLRSLTVSSSDNSFQFQLQELLDRAPHLRCLRFSKNLSLVFPMSLFKYTSASVRNLELENCKHQFNEEECIALIHSSLGVQCEQLSIQVKNRESIIILVQNMINLKALHVECENKSCNKHLSLIRNNNQSHDDNRDEIIQWLKDHLPSTCLISQDPTSIGCIRIWIK